MAEPKQTSSSQMPQLPTRLAGKARTASPTAGDSRGSSIPRDDRHNPNSSVQTIRQSAKAADLMRTFFAADGVLSSAITQFVATASTDLRYQGFQTGTNEFSRDGLQAAESVGSSLDTLWDYSKGFSNKQSLNALAETLLLETILTGACAAELVLTKQRIPEQVAVVPYATLPWTADGKGGKFPTQRARDGELIELNYPNFFVAEHFKTADQKYAMPVMVSGIRQLIEYGEFVEDMRRVIRQSGQPRLLVQLDYEKVRASAPPEIAMDVDKFSAYLSGIRTDMESLLSGLNPEDALVFYDLASVESLPAAGEKKDYRELLEQLSGQAASALKTNASALGLRIGGGSQNVASTEAMLSTKLAKSFQRPVQDVISRALTLAVRLMGVDVYVKAEFAPIELRPESELEAHRSMKQARVLELLSLGRITDDEAQSMLGLGSIPESAEELSGTRFQGGKAMDTLPASGTNARNASIMPTGPKSAGGKDEAQRV